MANMLDIKKRKSINSLTHDVKNSNADVSLKVFASEAERQLPVETFRLTET